MLNLPSQLATLKQSIDNEIKKHAINHAVLLLPASKTQPIEKLSTLHELGVQHFAENYVTEALAKIEHLPEHIQWHLIGPIQSNKTKLIATHFDWVHSIDRVKIIQRLDRQRPADKKPLNCLIQVNISNDPNKAGATLAEITQLATEINKADRLTLKGLMAITKQYEDETSVKADFYKMQQASLALHAKYPQANQLSMGMSADFLLAIEYGATMVRLGSILFGKRI